MRFLRRNDDLAALLADCQLNMEGEMKKGPFVWPFLNLVRMTDSELR
jgi:hypothetical protein